MQKSSVYDCAKNMIYEVLVTEPKNIENQPRCVGGAAGGGGDVAGANVSCAAGQFCTVGTDGSQAGVNGTDGSCACAVDNGSVAEAAECT